MELDTMPDALLSEIERQHKYLEKLPDDYDFPLFNARWAVESQRSSGYRNTAAAARELIDNAIEAGATRVDVIVEASPAQPGGQQLVQNLAIIDNGAGMVPEMARFALSWGGGTHHDNPRFIGKFGFGLPNASINQSRRVEVYTRTDQSGRFTKAWLDIDAFPSFGTQSVPEPVPADLPGFVQHYLDRNGLELSHGTVVVWRNPDRLTYKRPAALKEHMVDDFGVVYRYLLDPAESGAVELIVEGRTVESVDPLFLQPGARYYLPPEEGGAQSVWEPETIWVMYYIDSVTGERHVKRLEDPRDLDEDDPIVQDPQTVIGPIHLRIARFPVGFVADRGRKRGEALTDAHRRFDIRKPRRGISFVRAGREIQTVDAFPRSASDEASGLGHWPLLQGYAYHWAVEVRFAPELDDVFGVTNDKQGVRPLEDFWRVLKDIGFDSALHRENRYQSRERERKATPPEPHEGPSPAEQAAQDADTAAGRRTEVPERLLPIAKERFEAEAKERADSTKRPLLEVREALERESRRRAYRVEFFAEPHGPFYEPEWVGSQIVVRINTAHPFYEVLYGDLFRLAGGERAKEAVDLLLLALSHAELTVMDQEMGLWYEGQRMEQWSPYLSLAMKSLRQRLPVSEDVLVNPDWDPSAAA